MCRHDACYATPSRGLSAPSPDGHRLDPGVESADSKHGWCSTLLPSCSRRGPIRLPMPPVVIDVRNAEDARDVIHRAVQALAEGRLVAFPTETVYGIGASACHPEAVERLRER